MRLFRQRDGFTGEVATDGSAHIHPVVGTLHQPVAIPANQFEVRQRLYLLESHALQPIPLGFAGIAHQEVAGGVHVLDAVVALMERIAIERVVGNHDAIDGLVELLQRGIFVQSLSLGNGIDECLGRAYRIAARVGANLIARRHLGSIFAEHVLQVSVVVLLPKVAYDVVGAPRGVCHEGRVHRRPDMYVSARKVEGIAAKLGHRVAVHIYLIFLASIDAELIAPRVGCDVLAEGYLLKHLIVAKSFVVHQGHRIRYDDFRELCLINGLVAKTGNAFWQVERRDIGIMEGIIADLGHIKCLSLYRNRGRYRHLTAIGTFVGR